MGTILINFLNKFLSKKKFKTVGTKEKFRSIFYDIFF